MRPRIIKQGEYLAKLAEQVGFDADKVWNDDSNKPLRDTKREPNVLQPGDTLYVPGADERRYLKVNVGEENVVEANSSSTTLGLIVCDARGATIANSKVECRGLPAHGAALPKQTDGDGKLELVVPHTVSEFAVDLPENRISLIVHVAHMDPITEASGLQKRLEHLGYGSSMLCRLAAVRNGDASLWLRMQVAAFQLDQGLNITGEADHATRDKLVELHGV